MTEDTGHCFPIGEIVWLPWIFLLFPFIFYLVSVEFSIQVISRFLFLGQWPFQVLLEPINGSRMGW